MMQLRQIFLTFRRRIEKSQAAEIGMSCQAKNVDGF